MCGDGPKAQIYSFLTPTNKGISGSVDEREHQEIAPADEATELTAGLCSGLGAITDGRCVVATKTKTYRCNIASVVCLGLAVW